MLRKKLGQRIMAGMLGLSCLLAAATSQAAVRIDRISVHCKAQNETGEDEIYLKFNNTRVNMGSFVNNTTRATATILVAASGPFTVTLFEDDGDHWYDRDDNWGSNTVTHAGSYTFYSTKWSPWPASDQNREYDYSFTWTDV
jgi:hypothetical protein